MTRTIARPGGAPGVRRASAVADDAARFAGEWKSTFGVVSLEQKGDAVTGRSAPASSRSRGRSRAAS